MGFVDDKISSLAKALEPYFRQYIREILGRTDGLGDTLTWVQGGYFDKMDPSGVVGTDAAQLATDSWWYEIIEQPKGERSVCLNAFSCRTDPEAPYSIAFGWGGVCYRNPCAVSGGYLMYGVNESQAARYTESALIKMSSSWQTLCSIHLRSFTHRWQIYPNERWSTAGIHAYISAVERDARRSYAYRVTATTKIRNGVIELLQSNVTAFYETDSNYDVRVIVNDVSESLDYQVRDTGNSGRETKWCVYARSAESIGVSGYHDWTECT